ncbi:MAG: 3'-5' exonuclease [Cyclobacteriaceae bacterium]|nr:3'-5' exonuclease [Cyclobacteriaceae bacterium]
MQRNLQDLLIIDIETVSTTWQYDSLDERLRKQWERKAQLIKNEEGKTPGELFLEKAGIYAEFGKIVCISMGFFTLKEGGKWSFRVKSVAHEDEKSLLTEFISYLSRFDERTTCLCAHNGKEFDFPYLCRRLLINEMPLPTLLDNSGKKPWEVNFIDTMEMWKFGDWKSYTSLELLATLFGVDSSKSDMDGSMVSKVYYEENGLDKIAEYCAQDVIVTAQVYLKMAGLPTIEDENISVIP